MKKLILLFGCLFLTFAASAQRPNLQLGVTVGGNARLYNMKPLFLVFDAQGELDTILQSTLRGSDVGFQIGFFFRVTQKRRYAEIGTNFMRTSVPVFELFQTDSSALDETSVYGVEFPILVGYRVVNSAMFKLRINTGIALTVIGKVKANNQGAVKSDFVNPKVGLRLGTGFDLAFFAFDVYYTLGLTKELSGLDLRTQSHGFQSTISVIF